MRVRVSEATQVRRVMRERRAARVARTEAGVAVARDWCGSCGVSSAGGREAENPDVPPAVPPAAPLAAPLLSPPP